MNRINLKADMFPHLLDLAKGTCHLEDLRVVTLHYGADYTPAPDELNQFDFFLKDDDGKVALDEASLPIRRRIDQVLYTFRPNIKGMENQQDFIALVEVKATELIPFVNGDVSQFAVILHLGDVIGCDDFDFLKTLAEIK